MRISDWSSDVCSSDLRHRRGGHRRGPALRGARQGRRQGRRGARTRNARARRPRAGLAAAGRGRLLPGRDQGRAEIHGDRKSVVKGKSVSVRVALGGRRSSKKKKIKQTNYKRYK